MPWLQTCDLPGYVKIDVNTLYEVHFIPQYFLINKEGKLMYQNVLNDDADDYSILIEVLLRTIKRQL